MTEEQKEAIDDCKNQAAREFVLDEFEDLLHEHTPTMKKVFHAVINRAMLIYGDKMFEDGRYAGRKELGYN